MKNVFQGLVVGLCALFAISCAELNSISNTLGNSLFTDQEQESREAQSAFDSKTRSIEASAAAGYQTWTQAARSIRDADRSFVGQGRWKFDSDDEEYHAYCIALAERVDNKQMTFTQYDALRTRRLSEITARRQSLINSQPRSNSTNCRSVRNADGSISTNCF